MQLAWRLIYSYIPVTILTFTPAHGRYIFRMTNKLEGRKYTGLPTSRFIIALFSSGYQVRMMTKCFHIKGRFRDSWWKKHAKQ
jgi:hypothetical protein